MDDHTVAQIAPSGIFGSTFNISCTNPMLSAQEVQQICGQFGYVGSNPNVIILKRNVEGGNRQDDLRHTDYRAVVGLKGDLNDAWHYDVYAQYGASILAEEYLNDVSKSRTAKALNVVIDPATGNQVCQSFLDGTDKNCVPYDIFTPGGVTAAAVNYLQTPGFQEGQNTEQVVSGALTGDLSGYGMKSPFAKDGIGLALGAEYRRETLDFQPDLEFTSGDLAGQGAAPQPVKGAYDTKEIFGEARLPLVQDAVFAKEISVELGYRFSHYSNAGDTNAYKISGEWAINDDIRFRGGFNRAVRAPNVNELFTPQSEALDGSTDGCAGTIGSATLVFTQAQCLNTGVSAAQYGHIAPNPASQYNGIVGGNPNVKPETANTYSVGVVLTPHTFLPGFTFSADYFNIKITNVIQGIGADNILDNCATSGLAEFCSLVHRAPGTESLWLGTNGFIVDTIQNLGFLKTSGIDFAANYRTNFRDLGLGDYGGIAIDFLGTYTHDYQIFNGIPGSPVLSCVGKFGLTCQGTSTPLGGPIPSFKSSTRVTWTTPLTGFDFSVNWRFIGSANLDTGETGCADCHIQAFNYFDLAASYRFRDRYTVRVGVNNVFDRDPPIIGQGELAGVVGSGNTFPQVYDALGRFLFTSLTADF
jgi:iron complex outermembrane receptor protein